MNPETAVPDTVSTAVAGGSAREPVILALSGDPDAVAIAERVASRASAKLGSRVVARAASARPFASAVRAGRAFGFIVALSADVETTCLAPSELSAMAPWLLDGWEETFRQRHPAISRAQPEELEEFLLGSGRVVAILRTGSSLVGAALAGVRMDGGAMPRFDRACSGGEALP
jgi:hypothetical protein